MKKNMISRRTFSTGMAAGTIFSLGNLKAYAGQKIKVAGIYTQPIQQKWDARLHLALDAAAKRGEIDYVFSEKVSNTDINWFIAKAESSGALDAVSKYCYEHVKFASSALKKLPVNNASNFLSEIVNYLTLDRKA